MTVFTLIQVNHTNRVITPEFVLNQTSNQKWFQLEYVNVFKNYCHLLKGGTMHAKVQSC